MAIRVVYEDVKLQFELDKRINGLTNLRPLMVKIGEGMVRSTKARFAKGVGPNGQAWAPNRPSTIDLFVAKFSSSFTKTGGLSKRGRARASGKKPLIGETKILSTTINYQATNSYVDVGSPTIQANVMQFGAKARQFGRAPWGDIPPRPYLGVGDEDKPMIDDAIADFLDL